MRPQSNEPAAPPPPASPPQEQATASETSQPAAWPPSAAPAAPPPPASPPQEQAALDAETRWKVRNLKVDSWVKALSVAGVAVAAVVGYFNIRAQQEQAQQSRDQEEARRKVEFETVQSRREEDARKRRADEDAEKLRISLELRIDFQPIEKDTKNAVLILNIYLNNTGKDVIMPYSHKEDPNPSNPQYDGEGCTLSLTEHDLPDRGRVVYWGGRRIVRRFNILEKYDYGEHGSWNRRYRIRPKTSYHETEAVAVKRGRLYDVTVRFYGKGMGTITEIQYYYVK